jgi:hypothetical protein
MSTPQTVVIAGAGAPLDRDRDRLADPSVALGDLIPAAVREA